MIQYSNNFVYCTATVQLATFRTDLDLRQAKLGLCTTKDETELLTGCLNSCVAFWRLSAFLARRHKGALDVVWRGCNISLQGSFLLVPVCPG